jgi:DMSO/TMAO reductase YedYZ heme-binding membrane subunit
MHPLTAPETIDAAPGRLALSAAVGFALAAGGFAVALGMTGITEGSTSFWYLSRASGFVAYVLLWGSVMWGLLLSSGMGRRWMRPPQLLEAHQFLSTAAIGFAGFHGLILMGDRYMSFPFTAIVVPFTSRYEPLLVACGQIGFWLSVLLIVSFQMRRRIGGRAWRQLHYASFAAFWMAFIHGLLLGSDSANPWAGVLYLATGTPVVFLTLSRVLSVEHIQGVLVGNGAD